MRTASEDEMNTILGWARNEGWNPGLDDASAFYAADPEGFFIAEAEGAPVAAISVVNHTPDLAFLGLYLCRPDHRGQGIGYRLWQHAIRHAGSRTIGLDGVPDQQANYARSGFALAGQTRRFEGDIGGARDPEVTLATTDEIASLTALEAGAFGFAKPAFNAEWFALSDTRKTFVLKDSFATVRQCHEGRKIGPLIADDLQSAIRLIEHIAALSEGQLVIDIPEGQDDLADWCSAAGMIVTFGTARMYRGAPPQTGAAVAAASTLELG